MRLSHIEHVGVLTIIFVGNDKDWSFECHEFFYNGRCVAHYTCLANLAILFVFIVFSFSSFLVLASFFLSLLTGAATICRARGSHQHLTVRALRHWAQQEA